MTERISESYPPRSFPCQPGFHRREAVARPRCTLFSAEKPLASPVEKRRLSYRYEITVSPRVLESEAILVPCGRIRSGHPQNNTGSEPDFSFITRIKFKSITKLHIISNFTNIIYIFYRDLSLGFLIFAATTSPLLSSRGEDAAELEEKRSPSGGAARQRIMSLRSHIKELQNFLGVTTRHCRRDGEGDRWETVQRKGDTFVVNDQPFYVNGFNTYWLMILAVDPSTRGKVSEVLRQASSVGLTVCRTWAFNDGGWRALQKSPGVYDEQVFKALDFVVSEARKNKIRLILSLCNNWEGYGGKAQYVRWGEEAGLNLTSDDDFFSDPTVKGYYKANVQAVLNRVNTVTNISYREDPTIFAWELMNEPRCPSDPSGDKFQSWIQEMAAHVKSIDPLHLLGIGSEGFYGPSSPDRQRLQNPNDFAGEAGTDFVKNHKAFGIDFASAHLYPDSWLPKTTTSEGRLQFSRAWMQSHIEDAERLAMPVIFGEFGFSAMEEGQFNQSFRNAFIELVYETILNSTRRGGAAGGSLLWQLFPEGVDFMDDGYAVVLGDLPATASLLSRHSRRLQIFNSRCSWNCRWSCRKRDEDDEGRSILGAPSSVESPRCRTLRNEEE